MSLNTDHKYVWAVVKVDGYKSEKQAARTPKFWKPSSSWWAFADSIYWNWTDWDTFAGSWRDSALAHFDKPVKQHDEQLRDLLKKRRGAPVHEVRKLNKQIWRHRRRMRRRDARAKIALAAASGSFPKMSQKNTVINFRKLFGEECPVQCLHAFYKNIYHLEKYVLAIEDGQKQNVISSWVSLTDGLRCHRKAQKWEGKSRWLRCRNVQELACQCSGVFSCLLYFTFYDFGHTSKLECCFSDAHSKSCRCTFSGAIPRYCLSARSADVTRVSTATNVACVAV